MAAAATILAPTTFSFWNPLDASKAETEVITYSFGLFELLDTLGSFDDVDALGDLDELDCRTRPFLGAFDDVDALGDLDELDCRTLLLAIICALVLRLVRARRVVTSSVSAMQTCKRANAAREMIACLENAMGCKEVNLNNETMCLMRPYSFLRTTMDDAWKAFYSLKICTLKPHLEKNGIKSALFKFNLKLDTQQESIFNFFYSQNI